MTLDTGELISQALGGDNGAFDTLTQPYRRELQVHCNYRQTGTAPLLPPRVQLPRQSEFIEAYESSDLDRLVALLTDDVFVSMLPLPFEYEGRESAARFFASILGSGRRFELRVTRANGQPALGAYVRGPAGVSHSVGLFVLTLSGDKICALTRFENAVLPWFGLPRSIPSQ